MQYVYELCVCVCACVHACVHIIPSRSASTKQTKLHLSRGTSYTLPPLTLKSGSLLNLKLYCSVAVVPHLSLHRGRKIPANRTCQHLHVSF